MSRSEAYKEGYQSHDEGFGDLENPYDVSTPQWSDWRDGWRDARASRETSKNHMRDFDRESIESDD